MSQSSRFRKVVSTTRMMRLADKKLPGTGMSWLPTNKRGERPRSTGSKLLGRPGARQVATSRTSARSSFPLAEPLWSKPEEVSKATALEKDGANRGVDPERKQSGTGRVAARPASRSWACCLAAKQTPDWRSGRSSAQTVGRRFLSDSALPNLFGPSHRRLFNKAVETISQ